LQPGRTKQAQQSAGIESRQAPVLLGEFRRRRRAGLSGENFTPLMAFLGRPRNA
jgi:hypothetical protein